MGREVVKGRWPGLRVKSSAAAVFCAVMYVNAGGWFRQRRQAQTDVTPFLAKPRGTFWTWTLSSVRPFREVVVRVVFIGVTTSDVKYRGSDVVLLCSDLGRTPIGWHFARGDNLESRGRGGGESRSASLNNETRCASPGRVLLGFSCGTHHFM